MAPVVSIIICTRNRADSLRDTLASIGGCDVPVDLPAELLVVDNGSTDHTRRVVEQAKLANVSLRYVMERNEGQCHARNRGLGESVGQVILFTDDDVRVPLNWIEGMCRRILRGESDAIAGGVQIPPELLQGISAIHPAWLASTGDLNAAEPGRLVGANMAFGRRVLGRVPEFDVELGPGALGFHDETLFSLQLGRAGYRLSAALDVVVEHHFDPARLDRQGVLGIAERAGRSEAYVDYHWRHRKIAFSRDARLRARAGLFARQMWHAWSCVIRRMPMDWEFDRIKHIAYMDQLAIERRRVPSYEREGLVKRDGSASRGGPCARVMAAIGREDE
jgi:glycosyltransferase involved in cell wall biosynthesis